MALVKTQKPTEEKASRKFIRRAIIATLSSLIIPAVIPAPWYNVLLYVLVNSWAVFIAIYIGDWIRKLILPDYYMTDGTVKDSLGKRIQWSVGPQMAAAMIAMFIVAAILQDLFV